MSGMSEKNPFKKETLLYHKLEGNVVRCNTCSHQCSIKENDLGICKTRRNENGFLYSLNYGMVSSYSVNPIEKKPLFHYYPGSYAATIGSYSCNFDCPWCQNWSISKTNPIQVLKPSFTSPEEIVQRINTDSNITGISVSFNEPTLSLEYVLDIFNLLDDSVYKMFVTNGYMTPEALNLLINAGLTGMSVTIKGKRSTVKKYCKADVNKVWDNIRVTEKQGVHIEVVCLIIPTVNDNNDFYEEVANNLTSINENIPLHFTRFHPDYQFTHVSPTPIKTLEEAHSIAKRIGLRYVYLGNVYGHPLENTYCHQCDSLLIKRTGYQITSFIDPQLKQCPNCKEKIVIKF